MPLSRNQFMYSQLTLTIWLHSGLCTLSSCSFRIVKRDLTTAKVMVIVWRLKREYYLNCFMPIFCNVLPLQWAQLTKTVHTARLGREFVSVFFGLHDLSLYSCMFCFTMVSWVIFLYVWRWRNKLKWASFEFFLPPPYCGLGAGSIPFIGPLRTTSNARLGSYLCYWIGDVQDSQGFIASEMTYFCRVGR